MATPQRITRDEKTYYRVRIRRPKKGVNVDEYFSTKKEADQFIREVDAATREGRSVVENNATLTTFDDLVEKYLAAPILDRKRRPLKPSAVRDRQIRANVLRRILGTRG